MVPARSSHTCAILGKGALLPVCCFLCVWHDMQLCSWADLLHIDLSGCNLVFAYVYAHACVFVSPSQVASRQARREQYEAMMRAGTAYDTQRRMVIRVQRGGNGDPPLATAV